MSGAAFPATRRPIPATDCVRAYPQLIAFYVDAPFTALGMGGSNAATRILLGGRFFTADIRHVASQPSRSKDMFRTRETRSVRLLRPRNGGGDANARAARPTKLADPPHK